MIGDQYRPVTLGRSPIQYLAIHGEWNGIAVLVHRSHAYRFGRQLQMKGRCFGSGNLLPYFNCLHAQLGLLRGELSAGKATRVAGIVDDPDAHVAFFGFVDELADEGKVLRR